MEPVAERLPSSLVTECQAARRQSAAHLWNCSVRDREHSGDRMPSPNKRCMTAKCHPTVELCSLKMSKHSGDIVPSQSNATLVTECHFKTAFVELCSLRRANTLVTECHAILTILVHSKRSGTRYLGFLSGLVTPFSFLL